MQFVFKPVSCISIITLKFKLKILYKKFYQIKFLQKSIDNQSQRRLHFTLLSKARQKPQPQKIVNITSRMQFILQ